MLTVLWAPMLAAVSVVLGRAADAGIVAGALSCLMRAASVAAYHRMDEVNLVSSVLYLTSSLVIYCDNQIPF